MKDTFNLKKFIVRSFSILMAFALMGSSVSAATTGSVNGSFIVSGYNNEVVLNQEFLKITEIGGSSNVTTLIPTQNYAVHIQVSDLDGLGNSSQDDTFNSEEGNENAGKLELTVALFYSNTELTDDSAVKTKFDSLDGVNNSGDQLKFDWLFDDEAAAPEMIFDGLYADTTGAQATTWALPNNLQYEGSAVLSVLTDADATTFDFVFPITVSKVAPVGTFWYLAVLATDNNGGQAFVYRSGYSMQWYGEIQVAENASIDWGVIDVSDESKRGFASNQETLENTIFISNGLFAKLAQTTETWTSTAVPLSIWGDAPEYGEAPANWSPSIPGFNTYVSANPATFVDEDTFAGKQEFSIRARIASEENFMDGENHTTNRIGADSNETIANGVKTVEGGVNIDFDFFLQLSPDFQNGKYDGVITLTIGSNVQ